MGGVRWRSEGALWGIREVQGRALPAGRVREQRSGMVMVQGTLGKQPAALDGGKVGLKGQGGCGWLSAPMCTAHPLPSVSPGHAEARDHDLAGHRAVIRGVAAHTHAGEARSWPGPLRGAVLSLGGS